MHAHFNRNQTSAEKPQFAGAATAVVAQEKRSRTHPRMLIISPAKNEAQYIARTIATVVNQTHRPDLWIIVDDGSSDDTAGIAEEAAKQHSWIQVIRRDSGAQRRVGPGVIEAFYEGLAATNLDEFDYVCKLDADLELPRTYFADCFQRFGASPRLGTLSGKVFIPIDGRLIPERNGDEFSWGCAKLYRKECFQDIGGFVREVMWDGIDCHRCRMLGWEAVSDPDPRLDIVHLRPMGSSQQSIYHGRMRWGRGQYFMGTHPLYLLGISLYRMSDRPRVVGGLCILAGYVNAWLRKSSRYADPEFVKFLRTWQLNKLQRRFAGMGRFSVDHTRPAAAVADSAAPPKFSRFAGRRRAVVEQEA